MALLVPEYLQTQKYSAKRDRLTLQHGGPIQAGAWDSNDFKVIQRALGANMTVDVNAGATLVPANAPGNAGLYHTVNDSPLLGTAVASAHATLPRIDIVYVQVLDSTDGGNGSDGIQVVCASGTATAGTTLDSRAGAAALPNGALLLADILVPAASSSVVTANIRDRRTWARGARVVAQATSSVSNSTTTAVSVPGTTRRVEFSGAPAQVAIAGGVQGAAANYHGGLVLFDNAATSFDSGTVSLASLSFAYSVGAQVLTSAYVGSHVMSVGVYSAVAAQQVTAAGPSAVSTRLMIVEMPGVFADNT